MRAFDPEKVLVIAVGIDQYRQENLRLNGAAAYAERLAGWALARGVPAKNILLACCHKGVAPEPPPEVVRREPTYANIVGLLTDASKHDAELLLMYWCGHGVLNKYGERTLFTSDAYIGAKFNHPVNDILLYLRSNTVTKLRSQIVVIDACANYIHQMHLRENLPRAATLNIGDPRTVEQYVLYSASQGQTAKHNLVTGLNAFSDTTFEWLEKMPHGPVDPDTMTLTSKVRTVFENLRETVPGFNQMPMTVEISGTVSSDSQLANAGGIPVSGEQYHDIAVNGLNIAHTRHAAESCRHLIEWWTATDAKAVAGSAPPQIRATLIAALRSTRFDGSADNLDMEALTVRVFGTNQVARLFELLADRATTEALLLWLERVRTLWLQEADLTLVEQYFPEATRRMVADSYRRAAPDARNGWQSNLTEALHDLAGLPKKDGQRPLHRFVAAMELATDRKVDDFWFGIPSDQLRSLRAAAAEPYVEHDRLVIEIPNGSPDPEKFIWPAGIREHRYTPGRGWANEWHACQPTPPAIQEIVNLVAGDDTFVLGFLLPRAVFDNFPESWESSTLLSDPIPHWYLRPVVLHSADRRQDRRLRHRWTSRHAAIRTHLENNPHDLLKWVEHIESEQIYRAVSDSKSACVGLAFVPPDYCGVLRHDPLIAAIRAGAPYILWTTNKSVDWPTVQRLVDDLMKERSFDELPALLHEKRRSRNNLDGNIRLLWDDPKAVPEAAHMPGMQMEAK
ncbi:hypothetical protein GFY24_19525 [Nocardia sp. SYP-A9097]|uniref:VMAP-C domain-containing protein n=1 Tax=Nocardia sp. SYP-A9097 TaxID=2663237 RepID=UPI00129BFBFE|nr:caspase family protein [Nocardia sp. SYP-A9097]MRH89607.1 hypothetical protein [Nocardia sp. SYP-A9097]